MAQVKYGSGITGIKGTLGGHVFQGGNCGAIVRQKMGKLMPKSNAFINQQDLFRQVIGSWNDLSIEQKTAWNEAAPTWPHTNRFGDTIQVSGFNVFVEVNILALMVGQEIYATAFDYPSIQDNTFMTGTVNYSSNIINIGSKNWIGPYQKLMLFISDTIQYGKVLKPSKYYYAGWCKFDGTYQPNVWSQLSNSPHFSTAEGSSCWCLPVVISETYNSWFRYSPFIIQETT